MRCNSVVTPDNRADVVTLTLANHPGNGNLERDGLGERSEAAWRRFSNLAIQEGQRLHVSGLGCRSQAIPSVRTSYRGQW